MYKDGDRLYYEEPEWRPYDAAALERAGLTAGAAEALGQRGLPHNAYEVFVRSGATELSVAGLPGCGPAALLGCYFDDANSYWVALDDGSVWMRWGRPDEPADNAQRINTSVQGLQGVLAAWCALKGSGLDVGDGAAYEDAVNSTVIEVVRSDPVAFAVDEGWWPNFLDELVFSLPGMLAGDLSLYTYVRQDGSGRWVLDHPGYEDDDDDGGEGDGDGGGEGEGESDE